MNFHWSSVNFRTFSILFFHFYRFVQFIIRIRKFHRHWCVIIDKTVPKKISFHFKTICLGKVGHRAAGEWVGNFKAITMAKPGIPFKYSKIFTVSIDQRSSAIDDPIFHLQYLEFLSSIYWKMPNFNILSVCVVYGKYFHTCNALCLRLLISIVLWLFLVSKFPLRELLVHRLPVHPNECDGQSNNVFPVENRWFSNSSEI